MGGPGFLRNKRFPGNSAPSTPEIKTHHSTRRIMIRQLSPGSHRHYTGIPNAAPASLVCSPVSLERLITAWLNEISDEGQATKVYRNMKNHAQAQSHRTIDKVRSLGTTMRPERRHVAGLGHSERVSRQHAGAGVWTFCRAQTRPRRRQSRRLHHSALNPEGIVSLSPGLCAERYPGCGRREPFTLKGFHRLAGDERQVWD
jgi:hypothetical protein